MNQDNLHDYAPERHANGIGGGFLSRSGIAPCDADHAADCGDGDNQGTPLWLLRLLKLEFRFDGDLFAAHGNAVSRRYWTKESPIVVDAFRNGGRTFFANPPYSRGNIRAAAETMVELANTGNVVVALTRLEPTSTWFKIMRQAMKECRLPDCRLTFRGQPDVYNFPVCVSRLVPEWAGREARPFFWDAERIYAQYFMRGGRADQTAWYDVEPDRKWPAVDAAWDDDNEETQDE